jgi:hypothetical protein
MSNLDMKSPTLPLQAEATPMREMAEEIRKLLRELDTHEDAGMPHNIVKKKVRNLLLSAVDFQIAEWEKVVRAHYDGMFCAYQAILSDRFKDKPTATLSEIARSESEKYFLRKFGTE